MTAIIPAQIDWRTDDNDNVVPVSRQFGDVYYSLVDGLAESRYVFLKHNQLAQRFPHAKNFTIAESGFGTGLNFLATWQLWQQTKKKNNAHLHYISFEKYPLTKADFIQSLASWKTKEPQLAKLIDKLIVIYPTLIEGCHRLNFFEDNLTFDLWLGDACENLAKLSNLAYVDAWFLDGFAPSCNQSLWAKQIFTQIQRLSNLGTTVATFSCAGVVKRGLQDIGFDINKVKGFGRKREMLTAVLNTVSKNPSPTLQITQDNKKIAVIGAGVSGLMSAWALANRGLQVTLMDKTAPLAGASGNPRGVLSPKMTAISHIADHLHSIGYLYASRLFLQMSEPGNPILQPTGVLDFLINSRVTVEKVSAYPQDFAYVLPQEKAEQLSQLTKQDFTDNQFSPQGGLINTQALAKRILQHPNINFQQNHITKITEKNRQVILTNIENKTLQFDHAVICLADKSCQLDNRIFDFRKIRGQLSWFTPTPKQVEKLPKIPLKYNGYCASFYDENDNKTNFLLGASFIRNDTNCEVRTDEHQENREKLVFAITELQNIIPTDVKNWQSRVGVRAQTPDYHPLVGNVGDSARIWTLSGMGSKGYAFAPICAEVLADKIMGYIPAVSQNLLKQLSPNRNRLQQKLTQFK
ncbi:MAG: bifunctional tRNA (5-methylaminomethyl-2-thiouridine)(34)-methyltransferase MnmD/FAD-dependent 5-carboxymethylaminomethyl-2-thiouridine(34) oxidoreductase MnmC [Gammaproteobacteria bacterium]|nr:bifunctional tRNA (5-methylaminomethyl-2-thiouridine)(34)-methyltransferase MnmD/FAD-dependent 5-carboxymethylaminomethyl-2-thiouridine(34) oxidoreductase MnmC [Gammaproteobacteria bacterium]